MKKNLTESIETPAAPLKDGLPWQGFAIAPDKEDPGTWQLPHHTKEAGGLEVIGKKRAAIGKAGGRAVGPDEIGMAYEHTVDWLLLEKAALLLSRYGDEGRRVTADPELIIQAARHLAAHFRKAGRQIPPSLCVLI
jgi:hypothetical protein